MFLVTFKRIPKTFPFFFSFLQDRKPLILICGPRESAHWFQRWQPVQLSRCHLTMTSFKKSSLQEKPAAKPQFYSLISTLSLVLLNWGKLVCKSVHLNVNVSFVTLLCCTLISCHHAPVLIDNVVELNLGTFHQLICIYVILSLPTHEPYCSLLILDILNILDVFLYVTWPKYWDKKIFIFDIFFTLVWKKKYLKKNLKSDQVMKNGALSVVSCLKNKIRMNCNIFNLNIWRTINTA